jgi:1,4-alpha-glucan branching enzyme
MGWMHDTLKYFSRDPIYRKFEHNLLTFERLYHDSENFISTFSHDEVVHGKGSLIAKMGSLSIAEKAQTLRALYAYMWTWPGKKCLFMGSEFGQTSEWNEQSSLDWHLLQYADHVGIQRVVADLNRLYREYPFLAETDQKPSGFQWVNPNDADNSVLSYLRLGAQLQETLLVVGNFTPVMRWKYCIGVPHAGSWQEILNTNAVEYAGTGTGNPNAIPTNQLPWNDQPFSINLMLPPLTTVVLRYKGTP